MTRLLWRGLPRRIRQRLSLVLIGCSLRVLDLALRVASYKRVAYWLLKLSPTPNPETVNFPRARAIARLVETAGHTRPFRVTCLRRSLLLWWVLRWQSIPSVLRFGVNKNIGHTWVEHHQRTINDRPDIATQYAVLYGDEMSPEKMAARIHFTDS